MARSSGSAACARQRRPRPRGEAPGFVRIKAGDSSRACRFISEPPNLGASTAVQQRATCQCR
eukprot:12931702-Heterocapsa_arctica.AAC.1